MIAWNKVIVIFIIIIIIIIMIFIIIIIIIIIIIFTSLYIIPVVFEFLNVCIFLLIKWNKVDYYYKK